MSVRQAQTGHVLLLEDDRPLAQTIQEVLKEDGWEVEWLSTVQEAREKLRSTVFDLVLLDVLLPDEDGLNVVEEIRLRSPLTRVILVTGWRNMEMAAQAIRKGVDDLILKPFEVEELLERMRRTSDTRYAALEENRGDQDQENGLSYIVGQTKPIQDVLRLVRIVADKNATVLIMGESGTGKELVARALHDLSSRSDQSFVAINCGALPENLLEDELFGHVRGAFTDASQARKGRLEEAHRGTLFLDEIGEIPASLQVKLLRVLEEKEFQRLGSNQTICVDFRLVSATNADLPERVREGSFREDLFYRINVVPIAIPPLRERREDVSLLASHFLRAFSKEYRSKQKKLHPKALQALLEYGWPGNVRELRNAIELSFILSCERTTIKVEDFPTLSDSFESSRRPTFLENLLELPAEGINLNQVVSEVERNLILQSLERTGGNKGQAGRLLALKRTTLVEKLRRMQLVEAKARTG